jgi:hypothetical protein
MLVFVPVSSAADGPLPSSPAVDALLAAGPFCGVERVSDAPSGADGAPHIKVVYAYASDVGDRFGLFGTAIQLYTKAAAAKVALSSDKTLRLDRGSSCGNAFLDIQTVALGHPVASYATRSVLDDIQSRLPDRPGVNYLVFVDFALPVLSAAAGSWAQDDSPWATNAANFPAHSRYAYLEGGGADFFGSEQAASQYADQVLHEVLHTLGAVQPSAPHFSGGAHCYEIYDVMCYTPKDGTADVFLRDCDIIGAAPNPGKPLDCGNDDYFNPSPAPGSYLAGHWNVYDSGFLCTLARCDRPPAAPAARLAVVAGDGQSVTLSAASSSDPDGAVVSYVWDLDGDGTYDAAARDADGGGVGRWRAAPDRGGRRRRPPGGDGDDRRRRAQRPRSARQRRPGRPLRRQPRAGGGQRAEDRRGGAAPRAGPQAAADRRAADRRRAGARARPAGDAGRVAGRARRGHGAPRHARRGAPPVRRHPARAIRHAAPAPATAARARPAARDHPHRRDLGRGRRPCATADRRPRRPIGRFAALFDATSHSGQPPWKGSPLGCRRPHGGRSPAGSRSPMDTTRRGNYDSGEDFVLEYGELRFTFNERDFAERCEQAALKLGFVSGRLDEPELEDLVNLAVNGEIHEPASALGEHVNDCWPELVGPSDRSLVHWLRRLVFRSAWLDQRVKEGELDVRFEPEAHAFRYIQPDRDGEPVELAPEPSWGRVAYQPR